MMNKRRECLQLQKDEILRDPQAKYSGEWQVIGICGQAILPFLKTPGRLWWSYMLVITSCVQVSGDLLVATLWLISGNKCHFHYQSHPHGKGLKETKVKKSILMPLLWTVVLYYRKRLGYHYTGPIQIPRNCRTGCVVCTWWWSMPTYTLSEA